MGIPKGLILAPPKPPRPVFTQQSQVRGWRPHYNRHRRDLRASSVSGGFRSSGDSRGQSKQEPQLPWGSLLERAHRSTQAHAVGAEAAAGPTSVRPVVP